MTRTLSGRLALLLACTVGVVLLANVVVMRLSSMGAMGDITAHTLAMRIAGADALLAHGDEAALASLDVVHAASGPAGRMPVLPVMRDAVGQLQGQFPGRDVRVDGTRPIIVWIAARPPGTGWLGVRLSETHVPVARAGLLILLLAGIVVLLVAGLYARTLTAPLRQLAHAAHGVVHGDEPPGMPVHATAELKELRGALARAAEDVRASRKERDLMLAALSHDMRTPLARLRLGLELEATGDDTVRAGMDADIDALDALCEHFIAFARDGRDEAAVAVDIAALAGEIATLQASRGAPWSCMLPGDCVVMGKPLALRRAVENLVHNAVRHGAPPFAIAVDRVGHAVRVVVTDHGPGVPDALLGRLGEPFLRGNVARSGARGSGLGLASVRRTAQQHGGSLHLANLPAGGFAATLTLL